VDQWRLGAEFRYTVNRFQSSPPNPLMCYTPIALVHLELSLVLHRPLTSLEAKFPLAARPQWQLPQVLVPPRTSFLAFSSNVGFIPTSLPSPTFVTVVLPERPCGTPGKRSLLLSFRVGSRGCSSTPAVAP